jgi:GntR family transcriptional regulator/MocR family aminotransferase
MDLHVSTGPRGERAARIYRDLLEMVRDGRLGPGERLPPSRELAQRQSVSRGTVSTAYDRLVAEGFLESRPGSGTFVSPDAAPRQPGRRAPAGRAVAPHPRWASLPAPVPDAPSLELDLSVGGPDTSLFPLAVWRRVVSSTLRPSLLRAPAYDGSGHPELQAEIARFVGASRSVVAGPDDVLLTNGAQQALDLAARVLLGPGDEVAVEDPGYTAATRLFASHGARVTGVRVDEEGLVVDELPRSARLVYVTPSHQFPTGAAMSLRRRLALLDWAARRDAVVVEDDYDSEFRFEDRPLEPLQSLDRDGRVVYVGSFSKTLMPVLRIGYLVAPQSLQGPLRTAKLLTDWQGDVVTQGALARFMAEGLLASHLRKASRVYRVRRVALLDGLSEHLGERLAVVPSAAGLHLCGTFADDSVDDLAVVRRAADLGVAVEPLSPRYHTLAPRPGLALGFRHVTAERIPEAVARLSRALGGRAPAPTARATRSQRPAT